MVTEVSLSQSALGVGNSSPFGAFTLNANFVANTADNNSAEVNRAVRTELRSEADIRETQNAFFISRSLNELAPQNAGETPRDLFSLLAPSTDAALTAILEGEVSQLDLQIEARGIQDEPTFADAFFREGTTPSVAVPTLEILQTPGDTDATTPFNAFTFPGFDPVRPVGSAAETVA